MSARKLTDADKVEIVKLYRQTDETTSTLAQRYDVSHSTISRFLKSTLSPSEYETLIQQKRSGRMQREVSDVQEPVGKQLAIAFTQEESPAEAAAPTKLRRRRSSATPDAETELPAAQPPPPPREVPKVRAATNGNTELLDESYRQEANALREMLGDDLLDLQGDLADLDDEDDEDDEDEDDEDDLEEESLLPKKRVRAGTLVRVLPLSEASLPKTCYLVVDRAAELIARPLKDFGDLGQIPQEEVLEKTLPIFDNHRVARRFSNRAQRVIKVPDGKMLQKVGEHLKAKGITRLLIDGQVYSLSTT
jgi:transposase-like protein